MELCEVTGITLTLPWVSSALDGYPADQENRKDRRVIGMDVAPPRRVIR